MTKAEDYLRNFLKDNGLEIKSVEPIRKPIEKVLQKDEDKGCIDIQIINTDRLKNSQVVFYTIWLFFIFYWIF